MDEFNSFAARPQEILAGLPNTPSWPVIHTRAYPRLDYADAIQKMYNRMATSEHKYGPLEDNYPHNVDSLESALERIELYKTTGNREWLLDAANQLVIEFLFPTHTGAHFRATDSDESPGLRSK